MSVDTCRMYRHVSIIPEPTAPTEVLPSWMGNEGGNSRCWNIPVGSKLLTVIVGIVILVSSRLEVRRRYTQYNSNLGAPLGKPELGIEKRKSRKTRFWKFKERGRKEKRKALFAFSKEYSRKKPGINIDITSKASRKWIHASGEPFVEASASMHLKSSIEHKPKVTKAIGRLLVMLAEANQTIEVQSLDVKQLDQRPLIVREILDWCVKKAPNLYKMQLRHVHINLVDPIKQYALMRNYTLKASRDLSRRILHAKFSIKDRYDFDKFSWIIPEENLTIIPCDDKMGHQSLPENVLPPLGRITPTIDLELSRKVNGEPTTLGEQEISLRSNHLGKKWVTRKLKRMERMQLPPKELRKAHKAALRGRRREAISALRSMQLSSSFTSVVHVGRRKTQ
ncbi:hypothetical protein AAMO2058_001285200 [Amorphochlora amoebiformis]